MDFNELKMNVLAQAEECKNKEAEKANLEKRMADIVKKNASEIVLPYIDEMNGLLDKLVTINNNCYIYFDDHQTDFFLGEDVKERHTKLYISVSCNKIYFNFRYDISTMAYEKRTMSEFIRGAADKYTIQFFNWLGSEEKSLEMVDILKDEYTRILNCWSEHFTVKNKQLAESIKELNDKLSQGSSIEHKENGTVEIHLGGKTYKATLSEE